MKGPPEVYCELGAISPALKQLQHRKKIKLVHYPFDYSQSAKVKPTASPSGNWEDAKLEWERSVHPWESFGGSAKLTEIVATIGKEHWRDALHVDSAFKTGCVCFVTEDTDILDVKDKLFQLLSLPIYSPADEDLYAFLLHEVKSNKAAQPTRGKAPHD
ncbi:MAG TPA: hypothetical protein VFV47_03200 [Hyphomicrobiaceae bacterium]|jgi:hypothetical protein|nr:hypothetical protein [Hyphomicrobiaceae bacterium]